MSGLHHRNPGVVGSALIDKRPFAELICDGHHVHPDICVLTEHLKGDKLILITDCMRAGLMPDGKYMLGELSVSMKNGVARTESGSLAGSTLSLINSVKNMSKWSGKPMNDIWHKASLNPAKSLGLSKKLGSIAPEKIADYVVLGKGGRVQASAVAGEVRYNKK